VALIHAGFGVALLLADFDELLDFRGSVVRESELLESALLDSVVYGLCCLLKGRVAIRYMQEHRLHSRSLEGIKRLPNAQLNFRRFMVSGLATVDF